MSFLLGLLIPIRLAIAYNYLVELLPERWQITGGLIYFYFDASAFLLATIFFHYNKQWATFFCLTWLFNLISLAAVFFLPESPVFLKTVGRETELVAALEQIARWNCSKLRLRSDTADGNLDGAEGSNIHQSLLAEEHDAPSSTK